MDRFPWEQPTTVAECCELLEQSYSGRLARFQYDLLYNPQACSDWEGPKPGFNVSGWLSGTVFTIPLIWPTPDIEVAARAVEYWRNQLGTTMHGAGYLRNVYFGFGGFSVGVAPNDEGVDALLTKARKQLKKGVFPTFQCDHSRVWVSE